MIIYTSSTLVKKRNMANMFTDIAEALVDTKSTYLLVWLLVLTVLVVVMWSTLAVNWGKYQIPLIGTSLALHPNAAYRSRFVPELEMNVPGVSGYEERPPQALFRSKFEGAPLVQTDGISSGFAVVNQDGTVSASNAGALGMNGQALLNRWGYTACTQADVDGIDTSADAREQAQQRLDMQRVVTEKFGSVEDNLNSTINQ